jgi:peptidoglycan hydrolase CwlO-like protein
LVRSGRVQGPHAPVRLATTAAALALVAAALAGGLTGSSAHAQSLQSRRQSLQATLASKSAALAQTTRILGGAQARLAALEASLSAREQQLAADQGKLLRARNHLVDLENRLSQATRALSANLVAAYEGDKPDAVSVIFQAHGFADLLERVDFLHRMGSYDAHVITDTRDARQAVALQANTLVALETGDRRLALAINTQRQQAGVVAQALAGRQAAQLGSRASTANALAAVDAQVRRQLAQQAAAASSASAATQATGLAVNPGGAAQAPAGAPAAVVQVIAAGNAIATLPYSYGGGHASFHANAYDCSGSVSYALAAAGLLSSPLDSTGFESWGQPGPGQWITVYANAGHAYMVVAGWRFDTVALAQGGTRWSRTPADISGYVARHPPGL